MNIYVVHVIYLVHQCKRVWLGEYEPGAGGREKEK